MNGCGLVIDGDHLEKNIVKHMTRLTNFIFNICSVIHLNELVNLPSNEDIQSTFRNFENRIISCVNYFSKSN